jgi:flagella synthesis protein FlgN
MSASHPLLRTLQSELDEIAAFVRLLEQEQRALVDNKLADLVDIAKQKALRAQQLESLSSERKRLFSINGVELSPEPPHELVAIRHLPHEGLGDLAAVWRQLLQAARQASALNQTNGLLIETRQQQNQQLMALLQANSGNNAVLSYDAYGQARLSKAGASLGKA